MIFHAILRTPIVKALVTVVLAAAPTAGVAADVAVTKAGIEAGKLVIEGTTARPRTRVRLERQGGDDFNVTSGADRRFSFSLVYLPTDCVVTLEALRPPARASEAIVSDCARGISPRGRWSASGSYLDNDLVTHGGSSWLARRGNANRPPAEGADWQLFAAGAATANEAAAAARRTPPTGPAGGALSGTYPDPNIRPGAVTTGKLADAAVRREKLRDDAVDGAKVADESLTADDLAAGSVAQSEIALDAVTGEAVLNESLAAEDLAAGSVAQSEIAVDAVTGQAVLNETLTAADLAVGSVTQSEIALEAVAGQAVLNETLTAFDLAANSVGSSEIATDAVRADEILSNAVGQSEIAANAVAAVEIAQNSVDSDEIVDFGLSNQDIGVLFAEVDANGSLANSSGGGVTATRSGVGAYDVDFARNIRTCAAVATIGAPSTAAVDKGQINVADSLTGAEAVFVETNDAAGASADRAFRLVVVC